MIKLANRHNGQTDKPVNRDDLVMWTGEKIGLLSFSSKPGFTAESFEESRVKAPEDARREREEQAYSQTMRRTLEANINEVRYMKGLGLGFEGR